MHARQAAKGIYAQACIIGNSGQAAVGASVPRFGKGVFQKGVVRLGRFGNAERALGDEDNAQRAK